MALFFLPLLLAECQSFNNNSTTSAATKDSTAVSRAKRRRRLGAYDCTRFDSNMGAHFDLRDLQRTTGQPSYRVEDGDIPCTKSVRLAYARVEKPTWNPTNKP